MPPSTSDLIAYDSLVTLLQLRGLHATLYNPFAPQQAPTSEARACHYPSGAFPLLLVWPFPTT